MSTKTFKVVITTDGTGEFDHYDIKDMLHSVLGNEEVGYELEVTEEATIS
ncbi:hypothetical protein [Bacillus toyonensis]|nr:hypothetical protein [Bacillus toyonensis]